MSKHAAAQRWRGGLPVLAWLLGGSVRAVAQIPQVTINPSERRELPGPAADSLPRVLAVALPNSYRDSTAKRYPVVYVLDGDGIFGATSDIARMLTFGREIPEIILVGVTYGRPFLETPPLRWRNFTPTAIAAHPGTGHAPELLTYLAREVVPFVDSSYRTISSDRGIIGVSRSGLFVLYALYEQPGLFRRVLAGSPEVVWDNRYLFQRDSAFAASRRPLPATVYVSVGERELQRPFGAGVREFTERLNGRHYRDLRLTAEVLPGESHSSMLGAAITHGLKAMFAERAP
jgi:uncharacterized protein